MNKELNIELVKYIESRYIREDCNDENFFEISNILRHYHKWII